MGGEKQVSYWLALEWNALPKFEDFSAAVLTCSLSACSSNLSPVCSLPVGSISMPLASVICRSWIT